MSTRTTQSPPLSRRIKAFASRQLPGRTARRRVDELRSRNRQLERRLHEAEQRLRTDEHSANIRIGDLERELTAQRVESDRERARAEASTAEVTRYGAAYRRLLAAARHSFPWLQQDEVWSAPNHSWDDAFVDEVRMISTDALLVRLLRSGLSPAEAVVTLCQEAHWLDYAQARALFQALTEHDGTRLAGRLGEALVAQKAGLREHSWDLFRGLDPADLAALAPDQYLRAGLEADNDSPVAVVLDWLDTDAVRDAATLVELSRLLFAAEEYSGAQRAWQAADRAVDLTDELRLALTHLQPWLQAALDPPAAPPQIEGRINFGVIDYGQPDHRAASTNIGDTVQTIASLGHLLRHDQITLHSTEPDLETAIRGLQQRVRPEHRLPGRAAEVQLHRLQRDASHLTALPENTWALAFGWYMHPQFGLRHDFPFHRSVDPIFISFHCNRPALLSEEAIEYLRANGPIGCRDWTTVHLLLNLDVPAFFSGCLTTTIDTLFPDPGPDAPHDQTVHVDVRRPGTDQPDIRQEYPEVARRSLPENIGAAVDLLEFYQRDCARIVTSRLHCHLPGWSIGAPVEFRPKNNADVRFAGILGADDDDLRAMQTRIRGLLAPTIDAILSGATTAEVRQLWRELCAAEVAHAREVHEEPVDLPSSPVDLVELCRDLHAERVVVDGNQPLGSDPVEVAVALDGNLKPQFEVVVAGLVRHTSRPVRVHALVRDHDRSDHLRMAELFPEVTFEWYHLDAVDYGDVLGMLRHITVSTMDRLLLPELLRGVDRVVYHDLDALALVDVAALHDVELGGAPLAARPSVSHHYRFGLPNLLRATRLLHDDPAAAHELVRTMTQRHTGDFRAFNAGILVMDLDVMRADAFTTEFVPYADRYGLNDQDILNAYAGSRYRALDPRWNVWPNQEMVDGPWLLHWAGPVKPWDRERYIKERGEWYAGEDVVADRRAAAVARA